MKSVRATYKYLLILALAMSNLPLSAQKIELPLTERAEDGQFNKLVMVTPVFSFTCDSVPNPLDVSAAKPGDPIIWRKVKLPAWTPRENGTALRTGYAWVYNGSAPNDFNASHTLIAIVNPGWTYFKTLIWTDHNNNLDLTDDGAPDTMTGEKPVTLSLGNGPNPYQVQLEHFPADQFPLYCSINDAELTKVQGKRSFMGTRSSFRERRLNVMAGRWSNGRDSFSIAIKDVNCNGIYNDANIDIALIGDYHAVFNNLQGVLLDDNSKAYLEWNNCAYNLKYVDKQGSSVVLERDSAARLKFSLNKGQKMPRFKYCTATKPQKHKSIRRLKGGYTYVYIWRDAAEEFIRDSAELHHLARLQNNDFNVLALNYGGSGRYVFQYNRRYHTTLLQGFSSNTINRDLKIKKIPTGILLDKRQRIVAVGVTPEQARQILLNLSIIKDN